MIPTDPTPSLDDLLKQWHLEVEPGSDSLGDWNSLHLVTRDGEPLVLKVGGADHDLAAEAVALRAWDGRGAVRLVAEAPSALLLERLDPGHALADESFDAAVDIFAHLVRALAIPAPTRLPTSHDEAARIARRPELDRLPPAWATRVRDLARRLADDVGDSLVHGDLHSGNILGATRAPWLAIDPKPAAGHPERCVPEFLWNRVDEIDDLGAAVGQLVAAAGLDPGRTHAWLVVRTASYLLWAEAQGLTEDPRRCRRLIEALLTPHPKRRA